MKNTNLFEFPEARNGRSCCAGEEPRTDWFCWNQVGHVVSSRTPGPIIPLHHLTLCVCVCVCAGGWTKKTKTQRKKGKEREKRERERICLKHTGAQSTLVSTPIFRGELLKETLASIHPKLCRIFKKTCICAFIS